MTRLRSAATSGTTEREFEHTRPTVTPPRQPVTLTPMSLLPLALMWALARLAPESAYTALPGVETPAAPAVRPPEFAAAFQREIGKALVITDCTRDPAVHASMRLRNLDRYVEVVDETRTVTPRFHLKSVR